MRWAKGLLDVLGDKMLVGDGCWIWIAARDKDGYGMITRRLPSGRRTTVRAHRVVYELLVAPIQEGLVLDHYECDNPPCVRPSHMRQCTNKVNLARGMGSPRWSHCSRGHALVGDNVYYWRGRRKQCLKCMRATSLAGYYRRHGDHEHADAIMAALG